MGILVSVAPKSGPLNRIKHYCGSYAHLSAEKNPQNQYLASFCRSLATSPCLPHRFPELPCPPSLELFEGRQRAAGPDTADHPGHSPPLELCEGPQRAAGLDTADHLPPAIS